MGDRNFFRLVFCHSPTRFFPPRSSTESIDLPILRLTSGPFLHLSVFEARMGGICCELQFWPPVLCPRLQPPPHLLWQSPLVQRTIPCSYFSIISSPHPHLHSAFSSLAHFCPQIAEQFRDIFLPMGRLSNVCFVSGLHNLLDFPLLFSTHLLDT